MEKFLIEHGYKKYTTEHKPNCTCYQKRVDSERVCDLNDKLFVNIDHYVYDLNGKEREGIQAYICAEHESFWFDLKMYSIPKECVYENLDKIEQTLIKLFNSIEICEQ